MRSTLALLLMSLLAACADVRPDLTVPPQFDSSVMSSDGGGARALGSQPGVGVAARVGPVQ